jgi:cold shock CspA family protein
MEGERAMGGTVEKVEAVKGWGFIKGDDQIDRFFHKTGMAPGESFGALKAGDRVTFEHEDGRGDKGPRAVSVAHA